MKNLIKKTLEILKKKDKINIVFAIFLSIIRSILEVLGIGLILPILHFKIIDFARLCSNKKFNWCNISPFCRIQDGTVNLF